MKSTERHTADKQLLDGSHWPCNIDNLSLILFRGFKGCFKDIT